MLSNNALAGPLGGSRHPFQLLRPQLCGALLKLGQFTHVVINQRDEAEFGCMLSAQMKFICHEHHHFIKSPELPGKSALTGINARTDLCAPLGVARVLGLTLFRVAGISSVTNRRTPAAIACEADGIDAQRFAVIPMVIALRLTSTIQAFEDTRSAQQAFPYSSRHQSMGALRFSRLGVSLMGKTDRGDTSMASARKTKPSAIASIAECATALFARFDGIAVLHSRPRRQALLFGLAVGPATVGCKLRPNICPVIPQILALHFALRLLFDADTKLAPELLPGASSLSHVALRRSAARREICALGLIEAVEVGDKLVHTHILPDGNRKSIPFGDLPLGNGQ